MPRELSDLLEQAVSSAPPEKHAAGDITRLAERRQRRRTAGLAGGLALAVVVGAVAYGATRHDQSTPEPIGPWKYGQHHTLSDATPSAGAPWFRTYDYRVPSALPGQGGQGPIPGYLDVDAQGRLAAMRVKRTGADHSGIAAAYQIVDGPQGPVHDVPAPTSAFKGLVWDPLFTPDDQLLWGGPHGNGEAINDWVTDLDGGNAVAIRLSRDIPGGKTVGGHSVVATWFEDGRMWFTAVTKDNFPGSLQWVSLFSFDPAHPDVLRAEKPQNALAVDVGGGTAVWLDGTTVHAEDLATGNERTVPVPTDSGCHMLSADQLAGVEVPAFLSTEGDLISVVEQCHRSWRLVVTDLAGRVVADVDSGTDDYVIRPTLTGDLVVFGGGGYVKGAGPTRSYALDLRSGRFVVLGGPQGTLNLVVTGAGRYVLWYDRDGGHVGKLTE